MLDVHPPHHPVHAWRDFFVHIATIVVGLLQADSDEQPNHNGRDVDEEVPPGVYRVMRRVNIATIVVGLLIAIGLEQTVEAIIRHREVAETREALRAEFETNLLAFQADVAENKLNQKMLSNDLMVLRYVKDHPGTPEDQLPGTVTWVGIFQGVDNSAWMVAQQDVVIALMPRAEVARLNLSYRDLKYADDTQREYWVTINRVQHFGYVDPDPSHLSPAEVDRMIAVVEDCIDANFRWGFALANVNHDDPRFAPAPSLNDFAQDVGLERTESDRRKLASARKLTNDRVEPELEAVGKAERAIAEHAAKQP